jgi:hypothetical protein
MTGRDERGVQVLSLPFPPGGFQFLASLHGNSFFRTRAVSDEDSGRSKETT